jgi:hypothetical protein
VCIAFLSGMIGPKHECHFVESVYEQVGLFLSEELLPGGQAD